MRESATVLALMVGMILASALNAADSRITVGVVCSAILSQGCANRQDVMKVKCGALRCLSAWMILVTVHLLIAMGIAPMAWLIVVSALNAMGSRITAEMACCATQNRRHANLQDAHIQKYGARL
jgi:hypothetical protein